MSRHQEFPSVLYASQASKMRSTDAIDGTVPLPYLTQPEI